MAMGFFMSYNISYTREDYMENPFKKAVDKEETTEILENTEQTVSSEEVSENNEEQKVEEADVNNELQAKYDELNNQYIRLAADFDNYRKRQASEREGLLKYGAENTLKGLIEVLDNFERGLSAIETIEDVEKLKECYTLAYKNFSETLTKLGLEEVKAEGETFDPNLHEAVMQTPATEENPENSIVAVLQKGYKLGDKVLRPSLVNVAVEG